MDFSILDTIYQICPNDPAKAMTYIKECLIAEDLNKKLGTSYEAQLNCAYEGVDLLDRHSPPIQSKTTQSLRYECGSTSTVNEIAQKAINVNEQAWVSFAQIEGLKSFSMSSVRRACYLTSALVQASLLTASHLLN